MAQINKPSEYFNTLLWSGTSNSSARSFTGVGFQPDWVWQKVRTTTYGHEIFDSIRTTNRLASNTTNAENNLDQYGYISSFDADGFTATPGSTDNTGWNEVGQNYVAWNWLGGGAGVSNTAGDITSTVSASTTSGFSIVSYTGNGSNATVGHGLGVAPKMVIIKNRGSAISWLVGGENIGWTKNLYLNLSSAVGTYNHFQDQSPSSSFIYMTDDAALNASGSTYIAYCFAEKKGFSKYGSYVGNGSTNGTFVYTGMRPAFVMMKNTATATNWHIYDNKRTNNASNPTDDIIFANSNSAESTDSTANPIDFLSNGFKCRGTNSASNSSGNLFIYMAFAEHPFVTSTSVPTTAR